MRAPIQAAATLAVILAAVGCGGKSEKASDAADAADTTAAATAKPEAAPAGEKGRWAAADAFPSTYEPYPASTTVIRGATVLTGTGERIDNGSVLIENGKIAGVGGADLAAPDGAVVIDAKGKWVTPGVIDIHSHLGDYPSPQTDSTSDGNEATSPNTAQVWAEHSVWPRTPGSRARLQAALPRFRFCQGQPTCSAAAPRS